MRRIGGIVFAVLMLVLSVINAHAGDFGSELLAGCNPAPKCGKLILAVTSGTTEIPGVTVERVTFDTTHRSRAVTITTSPDWYCVYTNKKDVTLSGWGIKLKQASSGFCERFFGVEELPS